MLLSFDVGRINAMKHSTKNPILNWNSNFSGEFDSAVYRSRKEHIKSLPVHCTLSPEIRWVHWMESVFLSLYLCSSTQIFHVSIVWRFVTCLENIILRSGNSMMIIVMRMISNFRVLVRVDRVWKYVDLCECSRWKCQAMLQKMRGSECLIIGGLRPNRLVCNLYVFRLFLDNRIIDTNGFVNLLLES